MTLMTSWHASDEARAKGEDLDRETALSTDDRKRLDKSTAAHYHFQWPQTLLLDDATMGRLVKMFTKKTRYVTRLGEIRSLMEKGPDHGGKVLLELSTKSGNVRGQPGAPEEAAIGGLIQFSRRHLMLMIGYAHAAGPDGAGELNDAPGVPRVGHGEGVRGAADPGENPPPHRRGLPDAHALDPWLQPGGVCHLDGSG